MLPYLVFALSLRLALCQLTSRLGIGASAFASPSIPPPPPLSLPVWSLSSPLCTTADEDKPTMPNSGHSMNIVTFATAVSVAPPKIWAVSLYTNTLTRRAFLDSKVGVLQLLRPDQSKLVPILGKRSGYEGGYSKNDECKSAGFEWIPYPGDGIVLGNDESRDGEMTGDGVVKANENDEAIGSALRVLPGCASYIKLKVLSYHNAGDHDVALCEVLDTAVWNDEMGEVMSCRCSSTTDDDGGSALDSTTALYTGQLRQEGII